MALYSEKVRSRASALLFAGVGGVLGLVSTLALFSGGDGDLVPLLVGAGGLVTSVGFVGWGVLTSVLRVEVTSKTVSAQLGLQDVHIPTSAITHVGLERYGAAARRAMATAPNQQSTMLIPEKELVRVEWCEDDAPRIHYIGSEYPRQLFEAIEAARPTTRRVRVSESESAAEDDEAEAIEVGARRARSRA